MQVVLLRGGTAEHGLHAVQYPVESKASFTCFRGNDKPYESIENAAAYK